MAGLCALLLACENQTHTKRIVDTGFSDNDSAADQTVHDDDLLADDTTDESLDGSADGDIPDDRDIPTDDGVADGDSVVEPSDERPDADIPVIWQDPETGYQWQNKVPSNPRGFDEATDYCDWLNTAGLGGYSAGWRIPTISEMRTLVKGCSATEVGGVCGVYDLCSQEASCWNEACNGCALPAEDCYWPDDIQGLCGTYWSSTGYNGTNTAQWILDFTAASILGGSRVENHLVRCVRTLAPFCGDGHRDDPSEQCDDGNSVNTDDCKNDCSDNTCGDEVINEGVETCETGDTTTCTAALGTAATGTASCNGTCDGWATVGACTRTYTCSAKPTTGTIWNSVSSYTQTWGGSAWSPADDPVTEYNTSASTTTCRYVCDTGYVWDGSACVTDNTDCGNGTVDGGEECDDGNLVNTDACKNDCTDNICGDGVVNSGVELCEIGQTNTCTAVLVVTSNGDAPCNSDCTGWVAVGNCTRLYNCPVKPATGTVWNTVPYYTQTWNGSAWAPADDATTEYNMTSSTTACRYVCDTGYLWNGAACVVDQPDCGNGTVDGGEECDDGNVINTDACKNDCTDNVCGDGVIHYTIDVCEIGDTKSCTEALGTTATGTAPCDELCDGWVTANNCTRTYTCSTKPATGTVWNSVSSYTQTWNGSAWTPADDTTTEYNTTANTTACRYKCATGYGWNGNSCVAVPSSMEVTCTGQTKCYNETVEMTCPTEGNAFYGQDAQYAAWGYCTPRDYTVSGPSGNDIVIDNNTGLEWQRVLPTSYAGCSGGSPAGTKCLWQEAVDHCSALTYGGFSDWRLPTSKELTTLIDYGRWGISIDTDAFPFTRMTGHWSVSSIAEIPQNAWFVHFTYAYVTDTSKGEALDVRCVRGAVLAENAFVETTVEGKVIVTDSTTGLLWTKEYVRDVTWRNAIAHCESLNYGGYNDWRLPNVKELSTLIDDTLSSPTSTFPDMPQNHLWSSSSDVSDTSIAWVVYFTGAGVHSDDKVTTNYALCVRSEGTVPDCGNGETESGEECDDGNSVDTDACKNDCTDNICGDEVINEGVETCETDDTTTCAIALGTTATGTVSCNGTCDGWMTANNCTRTYTCPAKPATGTAWNSVSSYTQTWNGSAWTPADDTTTDYDTTASTTACRYICAEGYAWNGTSCVLMSTDCGNGETENDEECDDGNSVNTDACKNDCTDNICGDEAINEGVETCETGDTTTCTTALGTTATGTVSCNGTCDGWVTANNCTRTYDCTVKPATGTLWNTVSSYTQTWNGSAWTPADDTTTEYNTTGSTTDCRYICAANYTWDGTACAANTRTYTCPAKPATGTVWNSVSSYIQTWNGSAWTPTDDTTTDYNTTASTTACRYICAANYTWNGTSCAANTRTYTCPAKPATGTAWNTVSSYTQTWSGTAWEPTDDTTTDYNTTASTTACRYICAANYTWNDIACVANTRTYACPAKPATGTAWNTVSSYTQTWSGTAWEPADDTTTDYDTTGSVTDCRYVCIEGYAWNGTQCALLPGDCGNGTLDADEECDDGNLVNTDACKSDCTDNICGDGVVYEEVETCEPGGTATCTAALGMASTGTVSCNGTCDGWITANNCTKAYACAAKPANYTIWNTVPSYTQTWTGSTWSPGEDPTTEYNATPSTTSCRFACATNYVWNGTACVAATRTHFCSPKPETGTVWNIVASYTQTWNGSAWSPVEDTVTEYNTASSSTACRYMCDTSHVWTGTECSSCGNGYVDPGEECDLGISNGNCSTCTALCKVKPANICGDGFVCDTEECDNGGANSNTDECKMSCTWNVCGDGYIGKSAVKYTFDTGVLPGIAQNGVSPTYGWSVSPTQKYSGSYALAPDNIGIHSSTADVSFTAYSDGNICYYRAGSSQSSYDYLYVYIDGAQKEYLSGTYQTWTQVCWVVTPGNHTILFRYTKSSSTSSYWDAWYIDDLKFAGTRTEQCDDGNLVHTDACKADCTNNVCGDGVRYAGVENCDGDSISCTTALGVTATGNAPCNAGCTAYVPANNCTRVNVCPAKPATGTAWNTVGSFTQTWTGSAWSPADDTVSEYNTVASTAECRYTCATNYNWDGTTCVAATRTYTCPAKPTGTVWNTVSSYTQTWSGSAWSPADTSTAYNTTASTTACRYICDTNYVWNGSQCSLCGNAQVDANEECDNGVANANTAACKANCTNNICGDGYLFAGSETCDSGLKNGIFGYCMSGCGGWDPVTKQWGTSSAEYGYAIAANAAGAVFVTGYTYGSLDGNTTLGSEDVIFTKWNADGTKAWTKQWGSTSSDFGHGIALDASGNVYVTGRTIGSMDGNTNAGGYDIFLTKWNADGTKAWTKQWGSVNYDYGYAVALDGSGNIFVTGYSEGALDGNVDAGGDDVVLTKWNADGTKAWTKQWGTASNEYGHALAVNASGIYVAGRTQGALDGNTNAGGYDIFLTKWANDGSKAWTKQWGASSTDYGYGVALDTTGAIFVTGYAYGSLDGNTSYGGYDVFVTKWASDGTKAWTKQWGSSSDDYGRAIVVDSLGSIFVAGQTGGSMDGNTTAGSTDIFLTRWDDDGTKAWTKQWGTSSSDYGYGVALDNDGLLFVTGYTAGSLCGNTYAGSGDVFMSIVEDE